MKTLRNFALAAFALLGFAACQQEEFAPEIKNPTHSVTFVAGAPETKTTVTIDGNTAKFAWTEYDESRFTVYENGTKKATTVTAELGKDEKMTVKATFEGPAPETASYVAVVNESNATQIMSAEAYDEDADILVSKAVSTFDGENGVMLQFKREVAIAKMTLKGLDPGEVVNHVTVSSTAEIAGKYGVDGWAYPAKSLEISSASYMGETDGYSIVANASGEAVVWFTCIPQTDATLTVKVEAADGDTYTKEFSKPITLTRGDVKGFGVTMEKDVVAAPEPIVLYCSDVTTGSYNSTVSHIKNENLPFEYLQIMANGKNTPTGYGAGQVMQFKRSLGEIYNTESFGSPVKYVEVYSQSSNAFYVYYGDTKAPSKNKISRPTTPTGTKTISIVDNNGNENVEIEVNYYLLNLSSYNANYIRIVNGSSTNYFYKIVLGFDEPETVKVTGIALDKTEVTIKEGEKTTLTATITPSDATTKDIIWTSDNETVATVTDGVVSGLSAGSATITVTTEDGNYSATCDVTVTAASTGGEGSTEKTITFKLDASTTGKSSSSYVTTATAFTNNDVSFKVNQWNPSSLQIKCNQTTAGKNFTLYNTTAIPGKITKISIEITSGSIADVSKIYLTTSATALSSAATSGQNPTNNNGTLEWTLDGTASYFSFGTVKGGMSGTVKAGNIKITYSK